jgi:2-polyprenyl-3-methyl-5-hydroxy-6-metoxy-1,4-benzoquinol methylase
MVDGEATFNGEATRPARDHWFEDVADHLGEAYLRYSFTKGTRQEVDFLVPALGLEPGMRVLDVGCGPGRHAHELAKRGLRVHGVDVSQRFIDLSSVLPTERRSSSSMPVTWSSTPSSTPSCACARGRSA